MNKEELKADLLGWIDYVPKAETFMAISGRYPTDIVAREILREALNELETEGFLEYDDAGGKYLYRRIK